MSVFAKHIYFYYFHFFIWFFRQWTSNFISSADYTNQIEFYSKKYNYRYHMVSTWSTNWTLNHDACLYSTRCKLQEVQELEKKQFSMSDKKNLNQKQRSKQLLLCKLYMNFTTTMFLTTFFLKRWITSTSALGDTQNHIIFIIQNLTCEQSRVGKEHLRPCVSRR